MAAIHDAGVGQHAERVLVTVDVQLVARCALERTPPVRADLGANPGGAQKGERAPRCCATPEVEMERPGSCAAQVQAARGVEEGRQLRPAIAVALRRDARELLADVLGGDHRCTPSSASRRRLTSTPVRP